MAELLSQIDIEYFVSSAWSVVHVQRLEPEGHTLLFSILKNTDRRAYRANY